MKASPDPQTWSESAAEAFYHEQALDHFNEYGPCFDDAPDGAPAFAPATWVAPWYAPILDRVPDIAWFAWNYIALPTACAILGHDEEFEDFGDGGNGPMTPECHCARCGISR